VAGACLMELLIVRFEGGRLGWPSSALLSGLIVAFVLGPETHWAITVCVGTLATISKHLLTTRRWHMFNPAALALLVSIPLFGTAQSWWGALPDLAWPFLLVLLAGGAFVVDRINKFPLVLSFTGTYFGLFTLMALFSPAAVAEMFRAPFVQSALFMALFMLTDPPTSPSRYTDQVWIGALAGITSCVAQLMGAGQAYLLIGVLGGNVALAARRWLNEAQRRPAVRATGAGKIRSVGTTPG
jgi:Na+-translocating ferredoxin:NAD+ oxidoreductase RnfD subunit